MIDIFQICFDPFVTLIDDNPFRSLTHAVWLNKLQSGFLENMPYEFVRLSTRRDVA